MRYLFYLLTLSLVFTAGMLVGNRYVPTRNVSLAAAVSVPDLDRTNPAMDAATQQQAQENLQALTQALAACPAVVEEEKQRLFNQISLFLALQDFEVKRFIYAAEIVKNMQDSQTTAQFSRAAQDYSQAKTATETLANTLFPLPAPTEQNAEEPAEISAEQNTTQPSTATASDAQETQQKSEKK